MNDNAISWPAWELVLCAWNELDIPEVEIRAFEIGRHYVRTPWLERTGTQLLQWSNPLYNTGYHLACGLSEAKPPLRAAYKLHAFCVQQGFHWFDMKILTPAFRMMDAPTRWWGGTTKYVLPPVDIQPLLIDFTPVAQAMAWQDIVNQAAHTWREIAQRWLILLIPDFMEAGSAEYQRYQTYAESEYLADERAEYERLKKKFEA